jgi:hypothetical protein
MKVKPKKRTFLGDTFEQLSDTATSTVKKAGTSVNKTFNPLDAVNNENKIREQEAVEKAKEKLEKKNENHTPIDLKNFEDKYKQQDEKKTEDLRNRLFQLVKEGEKEAFEEKKKQEEERKEKEEEEERQKKRRREEDKKKQEESTLPKGKQRRSIFSPKKKAQEQRTEFKPSGGQG